MEVDKREGGYVLAYVLIVVLILGIVIENVYGTVTTNYTAAIRASQELSNRGSVEAEIAEQLDQLKRTTKSAYMNSAQAAFRDYVVEAGITTESEVMTYVENLNMPSDIYDGDSISIDI